MSEKRIRRRYSKDFKRRVVSETLEPGSSVAAVALRHGLNANMVFMWRRDPRFRQGGGSGVFLPVEMSEPPVRVVGARGRIYNIGSRIGGNLE